MNKYDTEGDSLDQLYSKAAKEKTPTHLDKKIMAEAKLHIKVKSFPSLFQWQRVLSVAAVMLLSIYIFFDVEGYRMPGLDTDFYQPQNKGMSTAPLMELKQTLGAGASKYTVDDASEQSLESAELMESDMATPRAFSVPAISKPAMTKQKRRSKVVDKPKAQGAASAVAPSIEKTELNDARLNEQSSGLEEVAKKQKQKQSSNRGKSLLKLRPTETIAADEMLIDIQVLLEKGDLKAARALYDTFKLKFPDYTMPAQVEETFQ